MEIIGGAKPQTGGDPGGLISDGTDQSFQADVLEASKEVPVIVDFWAPWCGPCKQLGPLLEAAVKAAGGKVKLVKINVDENPQVARQLRVQSIPTVYAFANAQPVDGFMGAVPPSEIDRFVNRLADTSQGGGHGKHEVEGLIARANESLGSGDLGGAAQDFAHALQHDPENVAAAAGMARVYLAGGDVDQAKQILSQIPEAKAADPAVQSAKTALELAERAGADKGELDALVTALGDNPDDHAKRFEFAQALAARGDFEDAVDQLLKIVEANREWNEGAAREELLKVFEAAGPAHPAAKNGRRRLSAILFA